MSEKLAINLFGSHARPEKPTGGRAIADDTQRAFHEYLGAQKGSQAAQEQVHQNDVTNAEGARQQRSQQLTKAETKADAVETDEHSPSDENVAGLSDSVAGAARDRARDPRARLHVSFVVGEAQMNGRRMPVLNDSAHTGETAQTKLVKKAADTGIDIVRAIPEQGMPKYVPHSSPSVFEYPELPSGVVQGGTGRLDSDDEDLVADAGGTGAVHVGRLPSSDDGGQEEISSSKAPASRLTVGAAVSALLAEFELGQAQIIPGAGEAAASNGRDNARVVSEGISNASDLRSEVFAKVQPNVGEMPARRLQSEMGAIIDQAKTGSIREKPQVASVAMIGNRSAGVGEQVAFAARMFEAGNSTMNTPVTPAFGDAKRALVADMPVMVPADATGDDALRISVNAAIGNAAPAKARNPVADRLGPVVRAQVVEGIRNSSTRSLQIQLAPVELGRVRITLNPTELGVQVVISAERLETLDLMRKFSADFEKALADIGYQQLDMTFSHQQTADQNSFESTIANLPDEASEEAPLEQIHYSVAENGMDIRI